MITTTEGSKGRKVVIFLLCIAIPLLVGFCSSLISGNLQAQYNQLAQPPLAPPDWLFGVAWSILYILMGISAYLVITANASTAHKTRALLVFAAQLVINFAWSILFFRAGQYWVAVVDIVLLDLLVLSMVMLFWNVRKISAVLLVPYLAWILFATYLNVAIAILN